MSNAVSMNVKNEHVRPCKIDLRMPPAFSSTYGARVMRHVSMQRATIYIF